MTAGSALYLPAHPGGADRENEKLERIITAYANISKLIRLNPPEEGHC